MNQADTSDIVAWPPNTEEKAGGAFIGTVAAIDDDGSVHVHCDHNPVNPARAMLALSRSDCALLRKNYDNLKVLLMNIDHPEVDLAIVGLLLEKLPAPDEAPTDRDRVHLDVTSLLLEASKDLVLRCGESQLTMQADGQIVLRGTDVISRSKGLYRIRGAAIRIN